MAFKFPRHPFRYPFHAFRGLVIQPAVWALFFLSPVLGIFQLDVIHQHMIVLGKAYPFNPATLMWVPVGFFGCVLVIALISTLGGRLFCGWVCPHNTMTEWTPAVRSFIGLAPQSYRLQKLQSKWPWLKGALVVLSLLSATAVSALIAVLFLFYFVPVPWFVSHVGAGTLPWIVWWGLGLMMLIGYFMIYAGHEFCRSACPYGISQSLSAYLTQKWIPMEIRYRPGKDLSPCTSCHACASACPVDIDPRKPENLVVGVGEGCFNCGECIDACTYVRGTQGKEGLLYFRMPGPADAEELLNAREIAH
jgi:ferredoxin-type protein NapH